MYKKQLKKFTFPALVALAALCLAMIRLWKAAAGRTLSHFHYDLQLLCPISSYQQRA